MEDHYITQFAALASLLEKIKQKLVMTKIRDTEKTKKKVKNDEDSKMEDNVIIHGDEYCVLILIINVLNVFFICTLLKIVYFWYCWY